MWLAQAYPSIDDRRLCIWNFLLNPSFPRMLRVSSRLGPKVRGFPVLFPYDVSKLDHPRKLFGAWIEHSALPEVIFEIIPAKTSSTTFHPSSAGPAFDSARRLVTNPPQRCATSRFPWLEKRFEVLCLPHERSKPDYFHEKAFQNVIHSRLEYHFVSEASSCIIQAIRVPFSATIIQNRGFYPTDLVRFGQFIFQALAVFWIHFGFVVGISI